MKKIIFIISFLLAICYTTNIYASETNEVLEEQEKSLGISSFLKEAESYTKDTFQSTSITSMYQDAISGNIEAKGLAGSILKLLGSEVVKTIRSLGYILIIIIVHSIIKNISEGLGNNEVGKMTYYVQYILIVTLIMTNFSDTISLIKNTVNSLVGFLNSLLPILLALMITTREFSNSIYCATSSTFNYNIYWKHNLICTFATCSCRNCTWNNLQNIR